MTQVLVIQSLAIVLLGLLVVGLLRSHAEILRKLHELGAGLDAHPGPGVAGSVPAPVRAGAATAFDVAGVTPAGEAVHIGLVGARQSTVLAFLSSGCLTCGAFWETFAGPDRVAVPGGARLVIVTKGPDAESESRVRELAPSRFPVVMSTETWVEYNVPHTPYFVYVDGPTGRIIGEASAQSWDQVVSRWSEALDRGASPSGGAARSRRDLFKAGLYPDRASRPPRPAPED